MKINLQLKKKEALKRMKLLDLLPNIITDFENENVVYYSELNGILFWVSNHPTWVEFIQKFEEKNNALVYHAELSRLEFGDCLSLFFVSDYKEEWKRDLEDIRQGLSLCYVWNKDDPCCSEFGTIGFRPINGGVRRTA